MEKEFPVVKIAQVDFEAIRRLGSFRTAIGIIRKRMVGAGINYDLPFSSWVDGDGNLCHQNHKYSSKGILLEEFRPPGYPGRKKRAA